jgi:hypothetical protein
VTVAGDAVLDECVRTVAASWVASWRETLRREGRAMEGGWPGTLAEARVLVLQKLGPELAKRGLASPPHENITKASRAAYAAARRAWLSAASPED